MRKLKSISRVLFGLLFVAAGGEPLSDARFLPPDNAGLSAAAGGTVAISGVAEILLGALLIFPRTKTIAAWGLIALLVAVFPANLNMAMHPEQFPDVPYWSLVARLPIQALLILWAFWYTRTDKAAEN